MADDERAPGWRPIKTAPADQWLLLCTAGEGTPYIGRWSTLRRDGPAWVGFDFRPLVCDPEDEPTHWMPVPAVPRAAAEDRVSDAPRPTPEQQAALDAYWSAATPADERAAYTRMMELGLPDGYAPQTVTMPADGPIGEAERAEWPPGVQADADRLLLTCDDSTTVGDIRSTIRKMAKDRMASAAPKLWAAAAVCRMFADPEVWATHGAPGEGKAARIERHIADVIRRALEAARDR